MSAGAQISHMRSCELCGEVYTRAYGVAQRDWLRRRFCSRSCSTYSAYSPAAAAKNRFTSHHGSVELASQSLLDRTMALYAKAASARGITISEAAVMMGMRA